MKALSECAKTGLVVMLFLRAQSAFACASCGSGSDDPLVLWPSENLKTYLGLSSSDNFATIDTQGRRGTTAGPKYRDTLTLAAGKALRNDLFATVTFNFLQNRNSKSSLRSVGDPVLAARWSWLMPDFTEPFTPQIQLMTSYKFAHARALQETRRLDLLDTFGTGLPEFKLGVDVFWGMGLIKGGFAIAALFPEERKLANSVVFPGNGLRTTGTLGYALSPKSKILAGMNLEKREQRRDEGVRIEGSEVTTTGFFLTGDWGITEQYTLRLSFSDKGRWGKNINTVASRTTSLAWLSTWE